MSRTASLIHILSYVGPYKESNRAKNDVISLLTKIPTLVPKSGLLVLNNGEECKLLVLQGTISIVFRNVTYHIPIEIYLKKDYPSSAPLVYVRPTSNMFIKKGHRHVDTAGVVYLPYLNNWSPNYSNLLNLCTALSTAFSAEPPVYSVSPTATAQRHSPPHQPSVPNTSNQDQYSSSPWLKKPRSDDPYPSNAATYQTSLKVNDSQSMKKSEEAALKEKLNEKINAAMKQMLTNLAQQLEAGLESQSKLKLKQKSIGEDLKSVEVQQQRLQEVIPEAQAVLAELQSHVQSEKEQNECNEKNPEDFLQPEDVLSKQLLELVSENASIEDLLYYLEKSLTEGCIELDDFLKEVRRATRKQFAVVALENKVAGLQKERKKTTATFNEPWRRSMEGKSEKN